MIAYTQVYDTST